MKRALLIAVVSLAATSALASKARKEALSNAAHLSDIQDVITKPDKASAYGEWATMEFGSTAGTTTRAEGGFVRMSGQAAWGAYLGAASGTTTSGVMAYRAFTPVSGTGASFLPQENPIRLFYAAKPSDMSWGVGLYHSASKSKVAETTTTGTKDQSTMGLTASASADVWDAQLALGLGNTASYKDTNDDAKMTGKTSFGLSGGYKMDTMYIYASYSAGGAKVTNTVTGASETTQMDRADTAMSLGIVNSHKKDGTDFFYGISYNMTTLKDDADATATPTSLNAVATGLTGTAGTNAKQIEITSMPLIAGIEAEATSWMVLRGSITQNFGSLGMGKIKVSEKTVTTADQELTSKDDTTIAAGVGLKWNKFTVDSTVAVAGANGAAFGTNSGNFLSKMSMTYTF